VPVSSPSYFPPNRSNGTIVGITAGQSTTGARNFLGGKSAGVFTTASDLIVIGDSALSAGTAAVPNNDANSQYSVIIGSKSAGALTGFTASDGNGPVVILGGNNLPLAPTMANTVSIGANIAPSLASGFPNNKGNNVLVGNQILQLATNTLVTLHENVILGALAYGSTASANSVSQNVIIGFSAVASINAAGCGANVIIGAIACPSALNGLNACVYIGQGAGANAASANQTVCVGSGTDAGATAARSVVVGSSSAPSAAGGGQNTILGSNINWSAMNNGILIGYNAGSGVTSGDGLFVLEANASGLGTGGAMFFGSLASGNLVIGNSANAVNRDFGVGATNVLKLLKGTKGGSTPVGGGYFYIDTASGNLHWFGPSGTDTQLAVA
jgi:hypothetical protein